jgi:WD40 repeat protein
MRTLTVPQGRFTAVCYSADGRYLLALQSGWRLHVWVTGEWVERFVGRLPGVLHQHHFLALVGDLAVGSRGVYDFTDLWAALAKSDKLIRRKDLIREVVLQELEDQFAYVDYVTDGRTIMRAHHQATDHLDMTFWDAGRQQLRSLSLISRPHVPRALAPGAGSLVRGPGYLARLHDCATGAEIRSFTHTDHVLLVAFSPDGRWLATGAGRSVWVWDVASGKGTRYPPYEKYVSALAFHPEGRLLAAADRAGEVRLIDLEGGRVTASLNFEVGSLNDLAFSPDGMTVAGAGQRKAVVVWDLE